MAADTGLASADIVAGSDAVVAQYNNVRTDIKSLRQNAQTAGETINGATLPVPCYMDNTDDEWYACDANDATKLRFRGFAITNGTNGNAITIQFHGIVGGFTGLTKGAECWVQDSVGTVGHTQGTYPIKVGIAVSTTEILIMRDPLIFAGTIADFDTTAAANNDVTVTCGFRPRLIRLYFFIQGHAPSSGTGNYLGAKGIADFIGTTNVTGIMNWITPDAAGDGLTGDNGNPNDVIAAIVAAGNSPGASLSIGSAGAGDGDISMTLSINSVSDTGFVIRRLTAVGAGTTGNSARAKIHYVAFE